MSAGLRVDLWESDGWRWRLWSSSRIIGQSSESYRQRARAIGNLETVTGGQFKKASSPDFPTPYGVLVRTSRELIRMDDGDLSLAFSHQSIPVRLVES